MAFDTSSILRMIGALGSAVGGVAGSFGGAASPTSPPPATSPTLDDLTLNPQVMGGQSPRIPYDFGQGPDTLTAPTKPPLAQTPTASGGEATKQPGSWSEGIKAFGDSLSKLGSFQGSVEKSPLAQQMFQEQQQKQIASSAIQQNKIEQFRRQDLSSQILERYGLL